jgi:uncharacterized OsmC-like protein
MAQATLHIRPRQDALKRHYRTTPGDARITDRGRTISRDLDDPVHVWGEPGSQPYGVEWRLGLHQAVAGLHDLPNPGDLLCLALATCLDSVVRMIANRHGIRLEALEVDVTGDVDVRGTLVVSRQVPVGFQRMHCAVRVRPEPGTDPQLVARLLGAAEYSCVNLQTLRAGIPVTVQHDISPA